jgi:hypothetical protein
MKGSRRINKPELLTAQDEDNTTQKIAGSMNTSATINDRGEGWTTINRFNTRTF